MKRKRRSPLALLALFLSVILVWLLAFVIWLFWADLKEWAGLAGKEAPRQEITEEERKELEKILKQRN